MRWSTGGCEKNSQTRNVVWIFHANCLRCRFNCHCCRLNYILITARAAQFFHCAPCAHTFNKLRVCSSGRASNVCEIRFVAIKKQSCCEPAGFIEAASKKVVVARQYLAAAQQTRTHHSLQLASITALHFALFSAALQGRGCTLQAGDITSGTRVGRKNVTSRRFAHQAATFHSEQLRVEIYF